MVRVLLDVADVALIACHTNVSVEMGLSIALANGSVSRRPIRAGTPMGETPNASAASPSWRRESAELVAASVAERFYYSHTIYLTVHRTVPMFTRA